MINSTISRLLGLSNKNSNHIEIKDVLNDAELQQGAQYLKDKKIIAQDVERHSVLLESFQSNDTLESDDVNSSNALQSLAKSQMDELNRLEQDFKTLLTKYSTLSKTVYEDEVKFLNRKMSKYVGKNIRLPGNKIYNVNTFGQARLYPNDEILNNKGPNCSDDYMDVGETTIPELGLVKGADMYKNEPCGYDGKIVQISEKAISNVNLCRIGNAVASQSSTYTSRHTGLTYPASNAIDGNTNTFNHTNIEKAGQYWEVKLGQNSLINKIIIYNRRRYPNRFRKVKLEIFDESNKLVYSDNIIRTVTDQPKFEVNGINKVGRTVRLTQLYNYYFHVAEVEVYGSYEKNIVGGEIGYVTGDGSIRPYPKNNTSNNTGTCPNMSPINISENVWDSFRKGSSMTESTQCEFGKINIPEKEELIKINSQLLDIANTIYKKIEIMQGTINEIREYEGDESEKINNQLIRFKGLFDKYNNLDKNTTTFDAMIEDGSLKEQSSHTKYILMSLSAVIVMLITYKIMNHK